MTSDGVLEELDEAMGEPVHIVLNQGVGCDFQRSPDGRSVPQ